VPDMQTVMDPAADPEILARQFGAIAGPIFLGVFFAILLQFAGYSAMVALMGDDRPTVGQALATGIKSVPSLLVVLILFVLAYAVGALVIFVPFSLIAGVAGAPALAFIGIIPVLLFVVWLMARMSLTMPAIVIGGNFNPFGAIGDSVKLTGPNQWQIMLFWVVIVVITTVASLILSGMVGVVAALMGSGTLQMLIVGLINGATGMITGMLYCALAAAMFLQLSGPSTDLIEETFD